METIILFVEAVFGPFEKNKEEGMKAPVLSDGGIQEISKLRVKSYLLFGIDAMLLH